MSLSRRIKKLELLETEKNLKVLTVEKVTEDHFIRDSDNNISYTRAELDKIAEDDTLIMIIEYS